VVTTVPVKPARRQTERHPSTQIEPTRDSLLRRERIQIASMNAAHNTLILRMRHPTVDRSREDQLNSPSHSASQLAFNSDGTSAAIHLSSPISGTFRGDIARSR
jgi:hypothetical protein